MALHTCGASCHVGRVLQAIVCLGPCGSPDGGFHLFCPSGSGFLSVEMVVWAGVARGSELSFCALGKGVDSQCFALDGLHQSALSPVLGSGVQRCGRSLPSRTVQMAKQAATS